MGSLDPPIYPGEQEEQKEKSQIFRDRQKRYYTWGGGVDYVTGGVSLLGVIASRRRAGQMTGIRGRRSRNRGVGDEGEGGGTDSDWSMAGGVGGHPF